MNTTELDKYFNPEEAEKKWYQIWNDGGYFTPHVNTGKDPYTIMIPPPNITGKLHLGHALVNTLQDVVIRMKRMQGYETLWLPGTDHASIATEAKVVDMIKKEGLSKDILGREGFLKRAWEWKEEYGGTIIRQLKKLGCSCDWTRERFTLDEGLSKVVQKVFIDLYNEGLIYKGERLVNWCPFCHSTLSDIEVEYEEEPSSLWYIRYWAPDKSFYLDVATTRPETMLGDTGVAVNPSDERFAKYIGKKVVVPIVNREIEVIADPFVETEFGTGCVKITPAHDFNDFNAGKKHGLEILKVIDEDGLMTDLVEKYKGMDILTARKLIVDELQELGVLVKIEPYTHNVGKCYRCHHTVEPMVSKQWFVKMEPLAKPAIEAVKNKDITLYPERYEKTYFHWMENIQDWCISRQLWWGHRIPAYYCEKCGKIEVAAEKPTHACSCGCTNWIQDEDTLDTWFSSALWPFSTLGWPEETEDYKFFYPTSTLITGNDILFFWVARMIFSALHQTGKIPFSKVVLHGLIRDAQGRKMSKSLNNGIDPLDVIRDYGADALRFSLVQGLSLETDIRYSMERLDIAKAFINKLWNSAKFVLNGIEGIDRSAYNKANLQPEDKWLLTKLNQTIKDVTAELETFEFGDALQKLYDFFWNDYCSWYIEMVKPRLYDENCKTRAEAAYVLHYGLSVILKLMHPFLPFVTEELYERLEPNSKPLIVAEWPKAEDLDYKADYENIELMQYFITSIRNVRANMNIQPSRKTNLIFVTKDKGAFLKAAEPIFMKLGFAKSVEVRDSKAGIPLNAINIENMDAAVYIPFEDLVDIKAEIERLSAEKEKYEGLIARTKAQLANEQFVAKAPADKVAEVKEKQKSYETMLTSINERLNALRGSAAA
jgi:valyl-tRNA synthetase